MSEDIVKAKIIRLSSGKFAIRYRLPGSRRWRQKTTTRHRRDAERELGKIRQKILSGEAVHPLRTCIELARTRYEEHLVTSKSDSTFNLYLRAMTVLCDQVAPEFVQDIDDEAIAAFVRRRKADSVTLATIDCHLRHIKAFLNWCRRKRMLQHVPHIEVLDRARRGSLSKGRPLTDEEFERMLNAVPNVIPAPYVDDWKRALLALNASGLRLGEAIALSWESDSPVRIMWQEDCPLLVIEPEADKKLVERLHPLTPDFADMLRGVPQQERNGAVIRFPLPRSKPGKPPRLDTVSKKIVAIGKAARIVVNSRGKFASAHDLRRTFGNRWSKRVRMLELKRLMRHESIDTTEKYYLSHDAVDFMRQLSAAWE